MIDIDEIEKFARERLSFVRNSPLNWDSTRVEDLATTILGLCVRVKVAEGKLEIFTNASKAMSDVLEPRYETLCKTLMEENSRLRDEMEALSG